MTSDDIVAINATQAYADAARTINAADGSVWLFKGYRQSANNNFLQLKAKSDDSTPYIKLPTVNGTIQSVVLAVGSASATSAGGNTRTYYFNDTIGGNGIATGTGAAEITLDVEGMGKSTGYIQVTGGATRVFSITVYYEAGEPAPAVPTLSVKEQPAEVAAAGADVTVELTAENLSSAITVTENADWITNATVANSKLTFTVTANETTETRTADITLTSGTLSATVNVSQKAQSTGGGEGETKTITCEFTASTMQKGCSNYTSTWTNISDGITFTVANANNNNKGWSYIRVGAKQSTDNISYVSTTTAFDFAVETVTVSCEKIRGSGTITVYVASNADFTSNVQTVSAAVATGDIALTIPTPATNMFYKVEFKCTNTSSSNGVANISSIVFNN